MTKKCHLLVLLSISSFVCLSSCDSAYKEGLQSNISESQASQTSCVYIDPSFPSSYNSYTDVMDGILYYKEDEISIMEGEINLWTAFGVNHDEQTGFSGKLFSCIKIPNMIPNLIVSSLVVGDHLKYKSNQEPHIHETYPGEIYLEDGDEYLGYEIVPCNTIKVKVTNGQLLTNEYPDIDFSYIQISRFALDEREGLIPLENINEAFVSLSLANPSLARAMYTYNPHP